MSNVRTEALPEAEAVFASLVERVRGAITKDAAIVGIYTGGAWLAERLVSALPGDHPLGFIDVAYYRDDYALSGLKSNTRRTSLPFEVDGATIVLVDDVLYTGRSARAAVNELFDFGRPRRVELAVLIDRGDRELPIAATYVGARVAVSRDMSVELSRDEHGRLSLACEPIRTAD